jgi:hypothetical protein
MRYTRSLISFVILTMLVGLGFLVLSADQARAGSNGGDICSIIIKKDADPADDTPFNFLFGNGGSGSFKLMDPSDNTETFMIKANTSLSVEEEVPEGWILEETGCSRGGADDCGEEDQEPCINLIEIPNGRIFECLDTDTATSATCTFFNVNIERNVPTLSQWGLIAMAGILGIVGYLVIRRKKATA